MKAKDIKVLEVRSRPAGATMVGSAPCNDVIEGNCITRKAVSPDVNRNPRERRFR